ncbi:hypothetical protein AB9F26_22190, partial [Falsihalocynthiibacter sp. BN13B15]
FLIREGEVSVSTETMRDALLRYAREVSPSKRGAKWEQLRLEKIAKGSLGNVILREVLPIDIANWRDMRLREVAAGTVNREMSLLSGVFSIARKEWEIKAQVMLMLFKAAQGVNVAAMKELLKQAERSELESLAGKARGDGKAKEKPLGKKGQQSKDAREITTTAEGGVAAHLPSYSEFKH